MKHRGTNASHLSKGMQRILLAAGVLVALLALCVLARWQAFARRPGMATEEQPKEPLQAQPRSLSPFQNTSPDASYVGAAVCAECHADQARSYQRTAHSLSLADIDVSREPANASFYHEASGRNYSVYRDGDQLRHREAVLDHAGEIAAVDYPIRYLIGSGQHTRSYVVEIDGFLCESPLTWYTSRRSWGMSPGYDSPYQRGFERPTDIACLSCHAGRVAEGDRGYQRLHIAEQAIGCERCHGPGSFHVVEQRSIGGGSGRADVPRRSIVNPARLSRELTEDVCAQCHLNTDAQVLVQGSGMGDFRPGLPLSRFRINYGRKSPNSQMTVVGHVEQMRLSRCYQASETLTCTTCHDPHSDQEPAQRRDGFIQVCLHCHADESCGLALEKRQERRSGSDCVTCHMPQVDTELQHIAFTHHRIGVHVHPPAAQTSEDSHQALAELIPLDEGQEGSAIDRERNLGLAYFALSQKQTNAAAASEYRQHARRLLESVRAHGGGDPEVAARLVWLYRKTDGDAALRLAEEAMASGALATQSETNCLFIIAESHVQRGQLSAAQRSLERLTQVRLLSEDWLFLGICRQQLADVPGARTALERAAALAPFRPEVHATLARVYEQLGETKAAVRERATASRLIAKLRQGSQASP